MIRILHSVSNMDRAGVETMLMNYYRHIDRTRVQFDFLCNKTKPGAYDAEIESMGGRIFRSPGFNPFKYPLYLKYMHQLFSEHPEYQIVHAHNGALVDYPLYAAKREKVPHRIAHLNSAAFAVDYKLPIKVFCRPLIPYCANHLWACGTKAAIFYYGKQRLEANRVRLVKNAIEIEPFLYNEKVRHQIRAQYGLEDKFVIGHVGRFVAQKNHAFLLDIFSEVLKQEKNAVLVLLGDGKLFEETKERAASLGLRDAVMFLGNVGNASEWYQGMDVFAMPSLWEGLPVSGMEAQAADLPCVFSDDITEEAAVLPTTSFISRKQPPKVWAERILALRNLPARTSRKAELQAAGYDVNMEAVKLMGLYEDMLAGKPVV